MNVGNAEIEVRRVAWRFWTWRLQVGDDVTIGAGTKAGAAAAVDRFLTNHGAKPVQLGGRGAPQEVS